MSAPLLQVQDLVRHYTMPREKLFGPPPVAVGPGQRARCIRLDAVAAEKVQVAA